MYCARCGTQNHDNAWRCVSCGSVLERPGEVQAYQQPVVQVPNYLVWAILATVFCCQPFGVVAIVYAAKVNSTLMSGDVAGAQAASLTAKTWCWVSFWVGLAVQVVNLAVYVVPEIIKAVGYH